MISFFFFERKKYDWEIYLKLDSMKNWDSFVFRKRRNFFFFDEDDRIDSMRKRKRNMTKWNVKLDAGLRITPFDEASIRFEGRN